jgi:hypothetical protein
VWCEGCGNTAHDTCYCHQGGDSLTVTKHDFSSQKAEETCWQYNKMSLDVLDENIWTGSSSSLQGISTVEDSRLQQSGDEQSK